MKSRLPALLAAGLLLPILACAQVPETKLKLQNGETVWKDLAEQLKPGDTVELRLLSGEKIAGKLVKMSGPVVQIAQLSGSEFFEAIVRLEHVTALVVRTK